MGFFTLTVFSNVHMYVCPNLVTSYVYIAHKKASVQKLLHFIYIFTFLPSLYILKIAFSLFLLDFST